MEQLANIIVTNGVGVGSFVALLYFMNKYLAKMSSTISELSLTLTSIKDSLITLSSRVDDIENKINNK